MTDENWLGHSPTWRAAEYLHGEQCACEHPERREGHIQHYLQLADETLKHAEHGHTEGCCS